MKKLITILLCMLAVPQAQAGNEKDVNRAIWVASYFCNLVAQCGTPFQIEADLRFRF